MKLPKNDNNHVVEEDNGYVKDENHAVHGLAKTILVIATTVAFVVVVTVSLVGRSGSVVTDGVGSRRDCGFGCDRPFDE